jgi:Holliday junction DNA helicase RuvA
MDADRLAIAVATEDADALTRVPGIGNKMAGRLIYELKGKIEVREPLLVRGSVAAGDGDVMAALTALGYTTAEAARAVASLPADADLPVEEKIRLALHHFAG